MYPQQASTPLQPAPLPATSGPHVVTTVQAAPIQTVIYPSSENKEPVGERYKGHFRRLGWTQIVLGVASIVLAIANICVIESHGGAYFAMAYIAPGIWCGIVIIVCGVLGVRATKDSSKCSVIGGLVMTIISASMFVDTMFALEIVGAIIDCTAISRTGGYDEYGYDRYICKNGSVIALHAVLALIAFVCIIVAIVHSAFSCAAICCGGRVNHHQGNTVIYTNQSHLQQPMANTTGAVNMYPTAPYVQPQYQMTPPYQNQQQFYQQPQSSMNQYPAADTMAPPPMYSSQDLTNTPTQVQEKQPL